MSQLDKFASAAMAALIAEPVAPGQVSHLTLLSGDFDETMPLAERIALAAYKIAQAMVRQANRESAK